MDCCAQTEHDHISYFEVPEPHLTHKDKIFQNLAASFIRFSTDGNLMRVRQILSTC